MRRPPSRHRCRECGQAIIQSGRARLWVHVDQFHQRLDHTPQPASAGPGSPALRSPRAGRSDADTQSRLLRMLESRRRGQG